MYQFFKSKFYKLNLKFSNLVSRAFHLPTPKTPLCRGEMKEPGNEVESFEAQLSVAKWRGQVAVVTVMNEIGLEKDI